MKKLLKYWYIPLFLAGGVLLFFLSKNYRGKGNPLSRVIKEIKAIGAESRAAEIRESLGAEAAKEYVNSTYEAEKEKLNEEQKKEADALAEDPAALAKFLVKAGK